MWPETDDFIQWYNEPSIQETIRTFEFKVLRNMFLLIILLNILSI